MTGTTSFINFDFGIGPLDLLIGYRMWKTKYKHKLVGTQKITQTFAGTTQSSTNSIDQSMSETNANFNRITAGIGFGF